MLLDCIITHLAFQSTLPRRERLLSWFQSQDAHNFNPRSREGSDLYSNQQVAQHILFQSTLPRRERHINLGFLGFINTFQSTLPRRERPLRKMVASISSVFQSTLPRRERRCSDISFQILHKISIHAPAKGATCTICG